MQLPASLLAVLFTLLIPSSADDGLPPSNASLLWGPYRPNLYMGIRPRVPDSLITGLMWGQVNDVDIEKKLRHTIEQNDGMATYGWKAYDAREGGIQTIEDVGNHMNITTEFIKKHDGQSAGNWGLRIKGIPRDDAQAGIRTSVIFYVGMEAMESCTGCVLEAREQMGSGDDPSIHAANFELKHPKLGTAGIHIPASVGDNGRQGMVVKTLNVAEDKLWQTKSVFLDLLKEQTKSRKDASVELVLHNAPGAGNMHFVQMICDGSFQFDVLYSSRIATRAMTSDELTRELGNTVRSFKKSLSYVFDPKAPFNTDEHRAFSETVLSNLLGGLAYFHGTARVDTSKKAIHAETTGKFWEKSEEAKKLATPETRGPYELTTHTPSRSTFPRGFLWDEGFHLITVLEWDADLAIEVIRSWLSLMDDDGWIAKEQILGDEARNTARNSFLTQYPQIANPPVMFLVLSKYIDMAKGDTKYFGRQSSYVSQKNVSSTFITEVYPLLKKHYNWFRKSQAGDVEAHSIPSANLNEGYRWRGRTPETNLASGLDDYPRVEPPDITELHVDALCWVGVMSKTLEKFASFISNPHDASEYRGHAHGVKTNLDIVHWQTKENAYCDSVVREDVHTHVCHKGYLSLYPLMTGFIDASHPHLPSILDLIHDPAQLWTAHGIRSLSATDKKYGVGDNYWRSPIWVNMNYLVLEQLLVLAQSPGPEQLRCRDVYIELRRNMVQTVFDSWRQTGYVWEQYDPAGGHGQRTQHFTGWTSLVVKMMAMPDLEPPKSVGEKAKEIYQEARLKAGRKTEWSAGSVVLVAMVVMFVWVTRRRFAGTWRSIRRQEMYKEP